MFAHSKLTQGFMNRIESKYKMTRTLLLVPTYFELQYLQPVLENSIKAADGTLAVCGFGPIASGIIAAQLLAKHRPEKVILVGIAGSFSAKTAPNGTAECYSRIGCYGVGAGSGSEFRMAGELGWSHFADSQSGDSFSDVIDLEGTGPPVASSAMLLTVCSASASRSDVAERLRKFPEAVAEDMEAFSVAMACKLTNIPLVAIRGISNIAGDRNKANWNVEAALKAAAELVVLRISE